MDGEDYLDPVPPQDALLLRDSTRRIRGEPLITRAGRRGRADIVVDLYGDPLTTLQVAVLERLPGKVSQELIRQLFEIRPLNADVAATIYQGFIRQVIDPNIVLLEAIRISLAPLAMFTNDDGDIADKRNYIRLVAFALRFGADPNQYVDIDQPEKVHILWWVQRFGIDLRESYGIDSIVDDEAFKSLVMYYLVLSGANYDMKVLQIDPEQESVVQALEKYPDALKSVLYNMELDITDPPEAFSFPYLGEATSNDIAVILSQRLTKIQQVYKTRDRPDLLLQKYPEEWTAEELLDIFYNMDYKRVANDVPQESIPDELPQASLAYAHKTYVSLVRRLTPTDISIIGSQELDVCCRFLDTNSVDTLLLVGAAPSYILKDKILNRMGRAKGRLPLTLDMNGKILWYFTRYGYSLDEQQMLQLRRIAPYIADELKAYMAKNPYWKGECNTETIEPSDNLREVARDAGLNPNLTKKEICRGLVTITSVSSEDAIRVSRQLNEKKLRVQSETLDEAIRDDKIEKRLKKVEDDKKRLERLKSSGKTSTTSSPTTSSPTTMSRQLSKSPLLFGKEENSDEESGDARGSRSESTNSKSPKSSRQINTERESKIQPVVATTVATNGKKTVKVGNLGLKKSGGVVDVKTSPTKVIKVNPTVIKQLSSAPSSTSKKVIRKEAPVIRGGDGGAELKYKKTKDKIEKDCDKKGRCKIKIEEETEELSIKEGRKGGDKEEKKVIIKTPPVVEKKNVVIKNKKPPTPFPREVPPPTPTPPSKLKPNSSVQLRDVNSRGSFTRLPSSSKDVELRRVLDAQKTDNLNAAFTSHSSRNTGDICENQGDLKYDPRDYNELDLTEYDDGETSKPWCFESRSYQSLLESRINPYTGKRLPRDVLENMRAKLKLLEAARLRKDIKSIPKGIRDLKGGGYQGELEAENAVKTLESLYTLYGLSPLILREDYTIADMQFLLDTLYEDPPILDATNREHALRTYAVVLDSDIYPGGVVDQNRADEVFSLIYDYGNPVAEGVEASPEELGEL